MPRHDTLWKSLLQEFFPDFIELVTPDLARSLDLESRVFLEQEAFSDPPRGRRAYLDLVAKVPTRRGRDRIVLIHIEIERRFTTKMKERMWRYFMYLRLKFALPILPIVLFLRGGPPGVQRQRVEELLGTYSVSTFNFWTLGLSRSRAEAFLGTSPLGAALASCTRGDSWPPEEKKYRCMLAVLDAEVDEARRFLLLNAVETYLELEGEHQIKYAERVAKSARNKEIVTMELTWAEKIEHQGRLLGRQEGRQEGQREGRLQMLQRLIVKRFGELPERIQNRLARMDDASELEHLGERLLEARSFADLGLDEDSHEG